MTSDEAADYIQGRLRRIGRDRALARAGAHDGDVVHIGELSFVWYRDEPEFTGDAAIAPAPPIDGRSAAGAGPPTAGRTVVVKIGSSSVTTGRAGSTTTPSTSWPARWPMPVRPATGWWW